MADPAVATEQLAEPTPTEPATTPAPAWDPASVPRVVPDVSIRLDRERPLRLSFKALRIFEETTGRSAYGADVWGDTPRAETVTTMLWCALLDDDPDLTLDQVAALPGCELGQTRYVINQLALLWGTDAEPPTS